MTAKATVPVRELELAHGYFSADYMERLFPAGIGSKQQAIPKRELPANAADPYESHRQELAA